MTIYRKARNSFPFIFIAAVVIIVTTTRRFFYANSMVDFDAIIVPAGGQTPDGPPPHVMERLDKAIELSKQYPKAMIVVTAKGTPHKPCPTDEAGFERPEAADNARILIERGGVNPSRIVEETMSLETVGNAYFARIVHTEILGLRRLAIINNSFHLPRTKAVFDHVFAVSEKQGKSAGYHLTYFEVPNALSPDVLKARLEREAKSLSKFDVGGEWRKKTPTLIDLHKWVFMENTAYASKRLLEKKEKVDANALKSY